MPHAHCEVVASDARLDAPPCDRSIRHHEAWSAAAASFHRSEQRLELHAGEGGEVVGHAIGQQQGPVVNQPPQL